MVISQGEVWWVDLQEPTGPEPGFRRPVVVVQGNALNESRLRTSICVAITSNLQWETAPGNVALPASVSGLPKDSIANVSQLVTIDRRHLTERSGVLPPRYLRRILTGIDVVLGR